VSSWVTRWIIEARSILFVKQKINNLTACYLWWNTISLHQDTFSLPALI
jgi:hypothetical protein